jgi:hypothetical protein
MDPYVRPPFNNDNVLSENHRGAPHERAVESGSDPYSDGRSEDEALWRRRPTKAGVAPDPTTTPPAAIARFDAVVKTHVVNDITSTAAEGRAEI